MKEVTVYRQNAVECRRLAATADPAHRPQLLQMADTWERLAIEREERDGELVDRQTAT